MNSAGSMGFESFATKEVLEARDSSIRSKENSRSSSAAKSSIGLDRHLPCREEVGASLAYLEGKTAS